MAEQNADYNTYDGIEVGAERIAHEVEETVTKLSGKGTNITKISIIGYSLGGLIARYAVGILYKDGLFDKLQPVNFTTFATPWIGVRSSKKGITGQIWNAVAPRTLSVSGMQMFSADNFRDTGRSLLAVMADSNSIFARGLKRFKHKSLYANTMNDRSVPFYTAAFNRTDPFVDEDAIEVHYMPTETEKAILDPQHPVTKKETGKAWSKESLKQKTKRAKKTLPMYALFTVMFPFVVTFMLVNGAYQTYRSAQRIRAHEGGKTLVDSKRYRVALLEEAQAFQDQTIERLANAQPEGYLPTPPPELANTESPQPKVSQMSSQDDFPLLSLTDQQFEMIDNLEQLGIDRYWCHIRKHHHTHAAIIVRYATPDFSEGLAVVNHWATRFEE